MPINANTDFTFKSYTITDDGIDFNFDAFNPGPGQRTGYSVFCTDAELSGITQSSELRSLLQTKLNRKIRATGIASKLDPFIGSVITV